MIQLIVNAFVKKDNQLENFSYIATIVGVLLAIFVAIGGVIKYFSEKKDKKYERYIEEKRNKGDKLTEIYKELLKVIDLFPNKTPYDVMNNLSFPPGFNLEDFDTVNRSLEIQIKEDYQKRLERKGLTYQDEEDIKTEIRNREYCIREIEKIKKQYFLAKKEYERFRTDNKTIALYASQDVKNCLNKFNVTWENAFIAGRPLEYNHGRNNKLDDIRWELEQVIRADLGII
jgi:hypothetical protein